MEHETRLGMATEVTSLRREVCEITTRQIFREEMGEDVHQSP